MIKSIVKTKGEATRELSFPCLMYNKTKPNRIILMMGYSNRDKNTLKGVVITDNSATIGQPLGYYSESWIKEFFEVYEGSVELVSE